MAAATPGFTVAATNATIGAGGAGTSNFTLTSVDGYAGTVVVTCYATDPPAGARLPYCGGGPIRAEQLAAGATVTGTVPLTAFPAPEAANVPHRWGGSTGTGVALAGVLLLGFGLRRRASRWLAVALLALAGLAGLAGISACVGVGNGLTTGTYPYTITGTDMSTNTTASSSFMVTVP